MKVGSLFSGIGGFDLGLEWAGMSVSWQVENEEFCLKILNKHWPEVPKYGDVKQLTSENLAKVDVLVGGFPCQPFSNAGQRGGEGDDRYLWPEMLRIIRELRPTWVIGENVPGIKNMALDQVLSDLEEEGYSTRTFNIPACGLDAPHKRERVWIVGHAEGQRFEREWSHYTEKGWKNPSGSAELRGGTDVAYAGCWSSQREGVQEFGKQIASWWQSEPNVGRVVDGIPNRVDRLRGLGNAVVPQIPYMLGCFIQQIGSEI